MSFKRRGVTSVREDVKKREPNYHVSGNVSWFSQSGKQYGNAKKKKNEMELPYDPAILLCPAHTLILNIKTCFPSSRNSAYPRFSLKLPSSLQMHPHLLTVHLDLNCLILRASMYCFLGIFLIQYTLMMEQLSVVI